MGEVTRDGRPAAVDFTFREPLESEHYAWLNWRDGKLESFTPPKLGGEDRADLTARRAAVDAARW